MMATRNSSEVATLTTSRVLGGTCRHMTSSAARVGTQSNFMAAIATQNIKTKMKSTSILLLLSPHSGGVGRAVGICAMLISYLGKCLAKMPTQSKFLVVQKICLYKNLPKKHL